MIRPARRRPAWTMGGVRLPVMPPVAPMLAKPVGEIPPGQLYEPKWDGFRSIIFRDGDEVEIGSRNERPMTRYFPEVVAAVLANFPPRAVIDGEIIVADTARNTLDFEALQQRIHPAASRVKLLSEQTPASFVAFDLLALDDDDLTGTAAARAPGAARTGAADAKPPIHITPATRDLDTARRWFDQFEGAGLDGLIAKSARPDLPAGQAGDEQDQARAHRGLRRGRLPGAQVRPGRGSGRCCSASTTTRGVLASVGVVGAFPMATRKALFERAAAAGHHVRRPPVGLGGPRAGRTYPAQERGQPVERRQGPLLRPAATRAGGRGPLRLHGGRPLPAHRPVRPLAARPRPESCTYDQLDRPVRFNLADILAG